MKLFLFLIVFSCTFALAQQKNLAEDLGYPPGSKVVIINADDYGMCHAENLGTQKVLEQGTVSSTTMMMPCSWIPEAIEYIKKNQMSNVGIHVALTSEWKRYRWGPISSSSVGRKSTLVDKDGYMWNESYKVELNADIEDVKNEVRAQLQSALDRGVDLSHFDSHMGSLYGIHTGRIEFLALALAISYEFGLPYRVPYAFGLLEPFRKMGFSILDELVIGGGAEPKDPEARKKYFLDLLRNLSPGVTEIYIHPAINSEELRRITHSAKYRQMDVDIFVGQETKNVIKQKNVHVINFKPLRKLQRQKMNWKPGLKAEDVYEKYREILQARRDLYNKWRAHVRKKLPDLDFCGCKIKK